MREHLTLGADSSALTSCDNGQQRSGFGQLVPKSTVRLERRRVVAQQRADSLRACAM
jgi:hypothetical protein